mgnify:CR=1 FL=1
MPLTRDNVMTALKTVNDPELHKDLVTLNMIPKVALGPLIIVWFKYGVFPNSMMAFSIAVFPILLTTARGLREIEPDLLDLVRSLRGRRHRR